MKSKLKVKGVSVLLLSFLFYYLPTILQSLSLLSFKIASNRRDHETFFFLPVPAASAASMLYTNYKAISWCTLFARIKI